MVERTHTCPICGATGLPAMSRYPAYVCHGCAARACSADGRPLRFTNQGAWGGFLAAYADTDAPYPGGGRCWIDGIACIADEARFGGIVVQVYDQGGGKPPIQ